MASKTERDHNGWIFQWKIENISNYWWLREGDFLQSPPFIPDAWEGIIWHLMFLPRSKEDENEIGVFLYRNKNCSGPEIVEVKYELAILGKDDSLMFPLSDLIGFPKNNQAGFFVRARGRVFLTGREAFLSEDTLTLQCKLHKPEEALVGSKYLYARTASNVNRRFFDWRINKFSTIQRGEKNYKDDLIELNIALNEDFGKRLDMKMTLFDRNILYISCNTSIIDSNGKMENCGIAKYFNKELKEGIVSTTVHLPKLLMEKKNRFLPNDVLTLYFQFTFSTIEDFGIGTKLENQVVGKGKSQSIAVLIDDLKTLWNDGNFCDIELRTKTKSFLAHKAVLSARSPVFKRIFSHDMKENNSGYVKIGFIEDDTIYRMLLFLYTAATDLQLLSAIKLYVAADIFDIPSLKCRCSSFLKQLLAPGNACDILILADFFKDDDLKIAVEDYILEQRKEFYGSQEWNDFKNSHSKLAAEIMLKRKCAN